MNSILLNQQAKQHQGEPVCWVNDQQLLLCSRSPRVEEPDNPLKHNLPRNIAGSAQQGEYCNTPLFRHADSGEVVALRGAYLRAGEREHELRLKIASQEALLRKIVDAPSENDMLKAVDRGMTIEGVRLIAKSGGASGDWAPGSGQGQWARATGDR